MNRSHSSTFYLTPTSGLSTVNFSSLSINDSSSTLSSNTSSSTFSSSSTAPSSPTPLSQTTRWGSAETRQAYGDLSSLAKVPVARKAGVMPPASTTSQERGSEDEWGFFVDSF